MKTKGVNANDELFKPHVSHKFLEDAIKEEVIKKVIPSEMIGKKTKFFVNATGQFVVGGPMGDCGLTGRKIIVDTYGGWGRHGGGCFSGKDPSKVDRSAAYMARYIAKNIVVAGLAKKCEIQIAYVIGVADPVSVSFDFFGTEAIPEKRIKEIILSTYNLRPAGIINELKLLRPIYQKTSACGHFGRNEPEFTWETTGTAKILKDLAWPGRKI